MSPSLSRSVRIYHAKYIAVTQHADALTAFMPGFSKSLGEFVKDSIYIKRCVTEAVLEFPYGMCVENAFVNLLDSTCVWMYFIRYWRKYLRLGEIFYNTAFSNFTNRILKGVKWRRWFKGIFLNTWDSSCNLIGSCPCLCHTIKTRLAASGLIHSNAGFYFHTESNSFVF